MKFLDEKFSYYDFLANFVPGTAMIFLTSYYFVNMQTNLLMPSFNIIADSLSFIIFAFVIGHLIQYFSKYSIEKFAKFIFWKGSFFSDSYLILGAGFCYEPKRQECLNLAVTKFGFEREAIETLRKKSINECNKNDLKSAQETSKNIYRKFDAFASDNNLGIKAANQNHFYSFFRGMTFVFIVGFIEMLLLGLAKNEAANWIGMVICLGAGLAFFHRMKERSELYIRGIMNSVLVFFSTDKNGDKQ